MKVWLHSVHMLPPMFASFWLAWSKQYVYFVLCTCHVLRLLHRAGASFRLDLVQIQCQLHSLCATRLTFASSWSDFVQLNVECSRCTGKQFHTTNLGVPNSDAVVAEI